MRKFKLRYSLFLMNKRELAQTIEHTALKPTITALDIENLCREAMEWGFFGVCV